MANYPEFVATILKEIARCINVPFTVAAMDASVANMSAAYADRQPYAHERRLEREELECTFLNPLLEMWVREASMIPSFLPRTATEFKHAWFWNSLGHHADPQKVANAISTELASGMTTLPLEHSKRGQDWEEQQESAAKSLGLTIENYRKMLVSSIFSASTQSGPQGDTGEGDDGDQSNLEDIDRLKAEADSYGVMVRAGVITPQPEDENEFRKKLGLPSMSSAARAAWMKDKNTRRPITITPPAGEAVKPIGVPNAADSPDDQGDEPATEE
jgi:hypothetical protein